MTEQTRQFRKGIDPGKAFATPVQPETERSKSRAWLWVVLIAIAAAAGYWGVSRYWQGTATNRPALAETPTNRSTPVIAVKVQKGNVPIYLSGIGSATALNTVTIRSRVDGQLDSISVEEGQLVHEGDVLAQIDPRPFQVQLSQAEGQLAKDQAALANARIDLTRYEAAQDAIPKQELDTQRATIQQDEGAVKIDQAQIDNARLQLTYCRITAPISGRIGLRLVDKGNIVHASDPGGLAVITQLQPIAVVFSISEDDLTSVLQQPNRGVGLVVDAYDRSFQTKLASGTLLAIDNQVDPTTGTLRLKAVFPNENDTLFPNQFVNARLLVDTVHDAVIVPAAAVQRGPDLTFVYVVKSDDAVEVRNVTLGTTWEDQAVIQSGLSPGETVVTDGVDKLQAGSRVSVRSAASTGPSTNPGRTRPSTRTGG